MDHPPIRTPEFPNLGSSNSARRIQKFSLSKPRNLCHLLLSVMAPQTERYKGKDSLLNLVKIILYIKCYNRSHETGTSKKPGGKLRRYPRCSEKCAPPRSFSNADHLSRQADEVMLASNPFDFPTKDAELKPLFPPLIASRRSDYSHHLHHSEIFHNERFVTAIVRKQ